MSLVPCPDCSNTDNPKRCRHCRGTGVNLDVISGVLTGLASSSLAIRDKCGWCTNGQCQTCGGQGKIVEKTTAYPAHTIPPETQRRQSGVVKDNRPHRGSGGRDPGSEASPSAWDGISVGGPVGAGFGKTFLLVLFLIIALPMGIYRQWRIKHDAIAHLSELQMNISIANKDSQPGVVRYTHGRAEPLDISVNWAGSLYESERPLKITLLRDTTTLYEQTWPHASLNFNSFSMTLSSALEVGRYLVRASVDGAPQSSTIFDVRALPAGEITVTDQFALGWPRGRVETLIHQPGTHQSIYIEVSLLGSLPETGKTVNVVLVGRGEKMFDAPYLVKEAQRHFYLPFQDDFQPGLYVARLMSKDEPGVQYVFRVQNPVVESTEEKNRRIQEYVDPVIPDSSRSSSDVIASIEMPNSATQSVADCYSGIWHNTVTNQVTWTLTLVGETLEIESSDGSLAGTFQKAGGGWTGFLQRRNSRIRWDGVTLRANETCSEIATNQPWQLKR